jgi:phosphatidate cytidylyltransferase
LSKPCLITNPEQDGLAALVSNDLYFRTVTAVIGIPILLFTFWYGGIPLLVFMAVVSVLGALEFSKLLNIKSVPIIVINLAVTLALYFRVAALKIFTFPEVWNFDYKNYFILLTVIIAIFIVGAVIVFASHKKENSIFLRIFLIIWGWIYTALFPALVYRLSPDMSGTGVLSRIPAMILIAIWITDSAAYFIGMKYGKHRGFFKASPNKSLEGFAAGLLAPLVFGMVLVLILRNKDISWFIMIVSISAGFFGQLGDLLESKLKRMAGVKDSSSLLPGHGGVLDRFDSLLVAAPALYIMILINILFYT